MRTIITGAGLSLFVMGGFRLVGDTFEEMPKFLILGVAFAIVDATRGWRTGDRRS